MKILSKETFSSLKRLASLLNSKRRINNFSTILFPLATPQESLFIPFDKISNASCCLWVLSDSIKCLLYLLEKFKARLRATFLLSGKTFEIPAIDLPLKEVSLPLSIFIAEKDSLSVSPSNSLSVSWDVDSPWLENWVSLLIEKLCFSASWVQMWIASLNKWLTIGRGTPWKQRISSRWNIIKCIRLSGYLADCLPCGERD